MSNEDDLRSLAATTIQNALSGQNYADELINRSLSRCNLSRKDRNLYVELVNGTIRNKRHLDHILSQLLHKGLQSISQELLVILELSIYQLHYLDRIPDYAVISESVRIAKNRHGTTEGRLVNGVLRAYQKNRKSFVAIARTGSEQEHLAIKYSHPDWIIDLWLRELGKKETELLCEHNNRRPGLHLRINRRKVSRSDYLVRLQEAGIEAQESLYFKDFVVFARGHNVQELPGFREGYFSVQDQSTAMATLLLTPEKGDTVIDLCAAPGGKSFHLANLLTDDGRVVAIDVSARRVKQLAANRYRLQNSNVFPIVADGTKVRLKHADKVIIDAPCSGLGVLSRRVDLRWKRRQDDLARFTRTQSALLANAASLLHGGGVLIYSTCTINRSENEDIVERFLAEHNNFRIEQGPEELDVFRTQLCFYKTVPYRHNMDGMFAVRMRKS